MTAVDLLIVGAGVVGLSVAREWKRRHPESRIVILEKEPGPGYHASGRNSGVLHSGVYYASDSLKAKVCAEGAQEMADYCEERGLPIRKVGKVILPVLPGDDAQLETLRQRARDNGATVQWIDASELAQIEPFARSATGNALYVPDVRVLDPKAVVARLAQDLTEAGVEIRFGEEVTGVDLARRSARTRGGSLSFGHLVNAAGLHADRLARACGVGQRYTILPFKGLYYQLSPDADLRINGLIYPVPDLRYPFLGVHFTPKVDGGVFVGPTALPALGRENYRGLTGMKLGESGRILWHLAGQYWKNPQGFRGLVHLEGRKVFRSYFALAARQLVPALKTRDLLASEKVGIRAQLFDLESERLVMDFLLEKGEHSTHVLNAISPAFTSAFSFSRMVADFAGE